MRFRGCCRAIIVSVSALVLLLVHVRGDATAASELATQPSPGNAPVASLDVRSSTLEKAIDRLAEQSHSNIVVHWDELQEEGVRKEAPVSLALWDTTVERALSVILDAGCGRGNAGFVIRQNIFDVSTPEHLAVDAGPSIRVYDVRDLIESALQYQKQHVPPEPTTQEGTIASVQPPYTQIMSWKEATDALVQILQNGIAVDRADSPQDRDWNTQIQEFGGRLVIAGTLNDDRRIRLLLRALRTGHAKEGVTLFGLSSVKRD